MTMQVWQPQVTERPHPAGYAGIKASLDAVVARIREGRKHPDVRSWAGKALVKAGNPRGHLARARALYEAQKAQNIWVPDPRGVEYMAGAHLVLGDGDNPPVFPAVDCDEQTIAYLSACESVGIPTCVVGASYDESHAISHVLGMITDEKGAWYYTDLSTDFPFGQAHKATYEEIIDVATGKRICMAGSCSTDLAGKKPPETQAWSFVGVNGPPEIGMLGEGQELTADQKQSLLDLSWQLGYSWDGTVRAYTMMRDVFATLGLPPPGDPSHTVWTPQAEQGIRDAQSMVQVARKALEEGAAGLRKVGIAVWQGGPLAGVADTFVESLPGDPFYIGVDPQGGPSLYVVGSGQPAHAQNSVGAFPVIPAIIGGTIVSLAVAYVLDSFNKKDVDLARVAAQDARNKREIESVTSGAMTPEQLEKLRRADAIIAEYEAKKIDAEKKSPIESAGKGVQAAGEGLGDMLKGAAILAAVLGVGYFGYQAIQKRSR